MTTATTIHPAWPQSPLVEFSTGVAGPDADPIDVLEIMLTVMHELEEKVPGVPFDRIFAGVQPNRQLPDIEASRAALVAAGVSPEDIESIMGIPLVLTPDMIVPNYEYPEILAMIEDGKTVQEIVALTGFGMRRVYRILKAHGVKPKRKGKAA